MSSWKEIVLAMRASTTQTTGPMTSSAAPQNIVRYNFFYASMNPGLMFKYGLTYGLGTAAAMAGPIIRGYSNTFT